MGMIVEIAQVQLKGTDKTIGNLPFEADNGALPLFPLLMEAWLNQTLPLISEQTRLAARIGFSRQAIDNVIGISGRA